VIRSESRRCQLLVLGIINGVAMIEKSGRDHGRPAERRQGSSRTSPNDQSRAHRALPLREIPRCRDISSAIRFRALETDWLGRQDSKLCISESESDKTLSSGRQDSNLCILNWIRRDVRLATGFEPLHIESFRLADLAPETV
jgi:hypothetical protein